MLQDSDLVNFQDKRMQTCQSDGFFTLTKAYQVLPPRSQSCLLWLVMIGSLSIWISLPKWCPGKRKITRFLAQWPTSTNAKRTRWETSTSNTWHQSTLRSSSQINSLKELVHLNHSNLLVNNWLKPYWNAKRSRRQLTWIQLSQPAFFRKVVEITSRWKTYSSVLITSTSTLRQRSTCIHTWKSTHNKLWLRFISKEWALRWKIEARRIVSSSWKENLTKK